MTRQLNGSAATSEALRSRISWPADGGETTERDQRRFSAAGRDETPLPIEVRTREILLIEDNLADIRLTQEALAEGTNGTLLRVARDGVEALSILRGDGRGGAICLPDLILLDLNLPRKDGRELLAELKQDPELRRIPVLVLTTSQSAQDVAMSYDLHANCYLTKPVQLDRFVSLIRAIEDFWFGAAILATNVPLDRPL